MIVIIGTDEFNIPTNELSNSVSAKVNKNAGKKFPKKPEISNGPMVFLFIVLMFLRAKGSNTNPARDIRIAATWLELKTSIPS